MKKVLVLYYSQSGQLQNILAAIVSGFKDKQHIRYDFLAIEPVKPFPYPWSFYRFFNIFPESVYLEGCKVKPLPISESYDLIILGYTTWFLSPSLPVTGFLQSKQAKKLFADTPVITVIACRDMWLTGQEKMKKLLNDLRATLIDNVVFTDQGKSIYSFITTPRWLLSGKKDPFWFFPAAGVAQEEINQADRFGKRIAEALRQDKEKEKKPLLTHLKAVTVEGKLIATEKIAHRSFLVWGKLIKKAGPVNSKGRNIVISVYVIFLMGMVFTLVPLNIIVRKIFAPLNKKRMLEKIEYYEQPSGR